ncbi:MAG: polysaccharide biosynthesis protein [Acidobacteria bacterium]|nr:polysaccharide biosynthesis protein [Acidobacteriota bacterium]
MTYLDGKQVLVTGGTGSFGSTIVERLLGETRCPRIVILSRDEAKQYFMRDRFRGDPRLEFRIGDVRDPGAVADACRGIQVIFHAAALKQVPSCEEFPLEAVKTNILGAQNVIESARRQGVERAVAISTDKAVKPVNAMGLSKALQEKLFIAADRPSATRFSCVRYGNVLNSRGSVIPLFLDQLRRHQDLTLTDERMTRFILTLRQATTLVLQVVEVMRGGEIFVPRIPALRVKDLAEALLRRVRGNGDGRVRTVGIRPGEKIHEVLVSEDEVRRCLESPDTFVILPAENGGGGEHPGLVPKGPGEFRSDTCPCLTPAEIGDLLVAESLL